MKNKILISIKPEYTEKIISGVKKYEYRRHVAKKDISSIIIYETAPIKRVVAEAEIEAILSYTPDELWKLTKEESGINKKFFDEYFKGKRIAHAYRIGKVKVFEKPKLLENYGVRYAPQSFIYISC